MKIMKLFIMLLGSVLVLSGLYAMNHQDVKEDVNTSKGEFADPTFMPNIHSDYNWTNRYERQGYERGQIRTH